jgi:hypothetical protein
VCTGWAINGREAGFTMHVSCYGKSQVRRSVNVMYSLAGCIVRSRITHLIVFIDRPLKSSSHNNPPSSCMPSLKRAVFPF